MTQSIKPPESPLPLPNFRWPVDLYRLAELWGLSLPEAAAHLNAHLRGGRLVWVGYSNDGQELWDLPECPASRTIHLEQ